MMNSSAEELNGLVDAICLALRKHLEVLLSQRNNPVVVIEAGEHVAETVLEHERALMRETGWSSPIRHLGRLPAFENSDSAPKNPAAPGRSVSVMVSYELIIFSEDAVVDLARGRLADEAIETLPEALTRLADSDGWNPALIDGSNLRVQHATVEVH